MDSVRSKVKDRIVGVPPRVKTVDGTTEQVFRAARQAMEKFGYRFTDGGPAQGRLEGFSRVQGGDDFSSARQRAIKIQLESLDGGQVEIQVRMTEINEEDSSHSSIPATETPVRDSSLYDAFFQEIEQQLKLPAQAGSHQ
jgi:hypothetical protein